MEALVAVGLVGNVVQFVDFASRLLHAAASLYESAKGTTAANAELESLVHNLQILASSNDVQELAKKTLGEASPRHSQVKVDQAESQALQSLGKRCMAVAEELLVLLDTLKVKGQHRGFESLYRAIRTAWKKRQLDDLRTELIEISNVLNSRVQHRQQFDIAEQLEELALANRRLESVRAQEIENLKLHFTIRFDEIKNPLLADHKSTQAWLELPCLAEKGSRLQFEQWVLTGLQFGQIDRRREAIPRHHAKTFQWLMDGGQNGVNTSSVNFIEWLQTGNTPFWITGKPGAGKSTLMKFLSSHRHLEKYLKIWAAGEELVFASHYFWSPAKDPLQKSQLGLLRTILYQILRQRPDLITKAFPNSRSAFETRDTFDLPTNDVPALLDALASITDPLSSGKTRFCFFIDGLDEYHGRPEEVIQLVETLQRSEQVKVCVSSRPWNEFEAHFGANNIWKLYVHHLTKNDIRLYVQDSLGANLAFRELKEADERCPDLVEHIVEAAQGVSLWVYLVVRSLLEGLTNADRIADLQRRLDEVPTDLEEFMESILRSIDARYRAQTARMLNTALDSYRNLPVLCYWIMDELDDNPEYVFELPMQPLPHRIAKARISQMRKRLNACSKGLLETRGALSGENPDLCGVEVDFLHRTVKDFLMTSSMRDLLSSWSSSTWALDSAVCGSILGSIKLGDDPRGRETDFLNIPAFFHHAQEIYNDTPASNLLVRILGGLRDSLHDCNTNVLGSTLPPNASGYWSIDLAFLGIATSRRWKAYVDHELDRRPDLVRNYGSTLLVLAIVPCDERKVSASDEEMLRALLAKGADPNKSVIWRGDHSPESAFELHLIEGVDFRNCYQALRILWEYVNEDALHHLAEFQAKGLVTKEQYLELQRMYQHQLSQKEALQREARQKQAQHEKSQPRLLKHRWRRFGKQSKS